MATINIKNEISEMSTKLGVSVEKLNEQLAKYEKELEIVFDNEKERKQAAFKQLRGSYKAQMKSKATWFEGFFFIVKPTRKENRYFHQEADKKFNEILASCNDDHEDAKRKAIKEGLMNENGDYLFRKEDLASSMAWRAGSIIDINSDIRELYGFFKEDGTQNIKFGIIYVRHNPKDFIPSLLTVYRFRANGKEEGNMLRINSATSTSLESTGMNVDYDMVMGLIKNQIGQSVKTFDKVYDPEAIKVKVPEKPAFYVSIASISKYNVSEKVDINVDFVELTDLVGDFEDPISMTVDKSVSLVENSVGMAFYYPTVRVRKKDNTSYLSGNLYSFLTKDADKPKEIKNIAPKSEENWE